FTGVKMPDTTSTIGLCGLLDFSRANYAEPLGSCEHPLAFNGVEFQEATNL
ncbi:hypothetical protein J6590_091467, partial [Homalodisca vitripennis]